MPSSILEKEITSSRFTRFISLKPPYSHSLKLAWNRETLERQVTLEEIKEAVWDCGSSKAPGPDGYSFAFVKNKEQSAFIAGRQILDGPVILSEIIEWSKTMKKEAPAF
ncbi:hypothetical protein Tco_0039693 [Tanacetum coccineum]